jgi:hypothetical protein
MKPLFFTDALRGEILTMRAVLYVGQPYKGNQSFEEELSIQDFKLKASKEKHPRIGSFSNR